MSFDNEASNRDNDAALDAADREYEEQRDRYLAGVQLGARVEHRVAVEAVVTALLHVLGKDRGDGTIDLGCIGQWVAPSYESQYALQVKHGSSF